MSEYNEELNYSLAHCAAYRIGEGDKPWCLIVKTVEGEVTYLDKDHQDDREIKFFIGMAATPDDDEQHRIVAEGYPVDKANLDMLVSLTDY